MATLYTQQDSNIRKTWLLMAVFFIMVIGVGWLISYAYNSPEILYIAVGFSLVMNIVAYWNSASIALAMSGAKPIPREGNEYIYRMVENLCITAGLPLPKIYIIESQQINAFATGRNPEHAAIAGRGERWKNSKMKSWRVFWPMNYPTSAIEIFSSQRLSWC